MPSLASAMTPRANRYSRVAILLHWAIALFILFNLAIGYFMEGFAPDLRKIVVPLHISAGMSVLALTVLRVIWRLTHPAPPHDPELAPLERNTAHIVHFLLYAGMVLMPLTGWAIISAHPAPGTPGALAAAAAKAKLAPQQPGTPAATGPGTGASGAKAPARGGGTKVWWIIPLAAIAPVQAIGDTPGGLAPQKQLHHELVDWHGLGGYVMIALLLLHILGALKHQYVDRHPELERMGIGGRRR